MSPTLKPEVEQEVKRRTRLAKKLAHARRMVEQKINDVRRAAALIGKWQKRCVYYERELDTSLTQKRAERERLLEARRKRRATRKITL